MVFISFQLNYFRPKYMDILFVTVSLLIYTWKFCTNEKKTEILLAKDELTIISLLDNFYLLSLDCF